MTAVSADLFDRVLDDVWTTVLHTWPYLLLSVLTAVAVTVYVGPERLTRLLAGHRAIGVAAAVLLATLTPFCSCGTTAVVLGLVAGRAPWAPIVAFMVASPLTSPSELVLSAGLFGWPFALVFFIGTIVLGLVAGGVAAVIEDSGALEGQARLHVDDRAACDQPSAECGQRGSVAVRAPGGLRLRELARELRGTGPRVTAYFLGYTALGYLVIEAVPTEGLLRVLSDRSAWGVPLAALLGVPAYLNTEGSLPAVAALVRGGLGAGPAMAFLVTGAGTSLGAISGAFVIARARVVGLVVGLLLGGGLALGWTTTLLLG